MRQLLLWLSTAVFFAVIGGLCVWFVGHAHETADEESVLEGEPLATEEGEQPVFRDSEGNVVVTVDATARQRAGIEVQALAAASHAAEVVAYGQLEEDPSRSYMLRAPLAGVLLAREPSHWPDLGDELADGAVVGVVEPWLGPTEQTDMQSRLAVAESEVESFEASLQALRTSYRNKQLLNANQKIVSDAALREAEAQIKGEEAQLKAARQTVRVLQESMSAMSRPADAIPLAVLTGGRVVEIGAQAGERVEAGQTLLRVARFDRLWARVSLSVGLSLPTPPRSARIGMTGHTDWVLNGEHIDIVTPADPVTRGQTFVFGIAVGQLPLQPGMQVIAHLPLPGEPERGISIPRSAVVRFAGTAWVYCQTGEDAFTRREVALGPAMPEGWFTTGGLNPGDRVVVVGAQSLLSRELTFQTGGGEEEEE